MNRRPWWITWSYKMAKIKPGHLQIRSSLDAKNKLQKDTPNNSVLGKSFRYKLKLLLGYLNHRTIMVEMSTRDSKDRYAQLTGFHN